MQSRSLSHPWAAPVVALALLVAACGGQADTELATIDDGTERVGDDADAGGPDDLERIDDPEQTTVETVERRDGDAEVDLPIPDAAEPAPPGFESSPAARQANQELRLPGFDEETGRFERLPVPEEDLDDASYLARIGAAEEAEEAAASAVAGQQPITIPVTDARAGDSGAPGSPAETQSQVAAAAFVETFDDPSFDYVPPEPTEYFVDETDVSADPGPVDVLEAATEDDENDALIDLGPDPLTDGSVTDLGSGAEPTGPSDEPTGPSDDAVLEAPSPEDCERRRWARGCFPDELDDPAGDLVDGGVIDTDGDAGDQSAGDESAGDESAGDESDVGGVDEPVADEGGVYVPQSVIDALLTDPDEDAAPGEEPVPGSGAEGEDGDGLDDPAVVVNPAGG